MNSTKEVLKKLLDIELKRLDVAVRIEGERSIVFPETTVIIRDIQKLTAAINGKDVIETDNKSQAKSDKDNEGLPDWARSRRR